MPHQQFRQRERQLLYEVIAKQAPHLLPLLGILGRALLNVEQREELRGAIATELSETGLNEDYEPNAYGLRLETLIDSLGHV